MLGDFSGAGAERSTPEQRYVLQAASQSALRLRLKELAHTRVRYGYWRLHVLLRREGWTANAKGIYWLRRSGTPVSAAARPWPVRQKRRQPTTERA
jgi:putative transposase